MQLMLAGLDAVHGTIMWLILYCVKLPEVQYRIQKELDHHLGELTKHVMLYLANQFNLNIGL